MDEVTASQILAEMKPAWRAALGDRVSHEYVAGFIRRNRVRLEAALAPIAAAMNAVPEVHFAEPAPKSEARDKARSTRLRSAATNLAHRRVQVAADSIAKLRHQDVERVLRETPAEERRQVAFILGDLRTDLSSEIDEVMREVLGEPANWSEYGRQEIYEPGSRAKREALAAEEASESFQQGDFNALGAVHLPPPTPSECSVERALEAAAPMIAEAEREISSAKGEPLPVVMASLEAGGILLLSPLGFLGRDLFQTYRDATSRLQYVSYPKKGQRGIPKVVARAVLALERDGFEVRAETPEVVKSLIVTGGLDHALPVGPPPPRAPRDEPGRPPTRTSDPDLIARVNALAADPPTSTLKYLVKTLRERGDLPLQVKDWKEGGWRPVETAIEEAEGKAARKLARKPKAERLRADGVERPAKDANEEHAAQALVQLANMDPDKARDVNEAGFSKSDVATGHTLARRWEATGELTGDEWDWAVAVANKYRRQVGPLPESRAATAPTMAWPPRQAIVIAWLVDDIEIVSIGRTDLGERPVTRDIKVPKAAMWMNSGTVEDVEKAEEYAAKDGHSVFFFPDDHPDPLGAAKRLIVEGPRDPLKALVDRLHGETPKAPPKSKRQQSKASGLSAEDRLFVGVMPTGIVYADRSREIDGDYARCAFLPFDTLALEIAPKCPKDMLGAIKTDAATIIARRGEQFKISASNQTVVLGSKHADVPAASTTAPTNTPSGRVNLSSAASRMLAKMTNGTWFLTFSRKATESIAAAIELRDAGLAKLTDHDNGELRVALPMLTMGDHERASTILNITHPEWGTKRFNLDSSERGHHSYGTGSNSAVLFASEFPGWVVASWLPTAAEVAAEHAERGAYLDANRPGWRESKRAPAPSAKEPGSKKGNNPLSYAGHSLATVQDIAAFLKRSLGKLYERYMLNINVVRNVGDHSVMLTFYRVPPDSGELEAANAKCKVRINIHGAGRTNGSTWPDDATPAELTAYTVWVHNAPKFRKRTGPPSVIVAAVSSWFVLNIADLTGTSAPPTPAGRLRDVRIDDMDAQVAREEAAMGNALRAERDREEAEWSGAVLRGVKAEIANGHDAETAKRIAVANLGKDFEHYNKRGEERGERP